MRRCPPRAREGCSARRQANAAARQPAARAARQAAVDRRDTTVQPIEGCVRIACSVQCRIAGRRIEFTGDLVALLAHIATHDGKQRDGVEHVDNDIPRSFDGVGRAQNRCGHHSDSQCGADRLRGNGDESSDAATIVGEGELEAAHVPRNR